MGDSCLTVTIKDGKTTFLALVENGCGKVTSTIGVSLTDCPTCHHLGGKKAVPVFDEASSAAILEAVMVPDIPGAVLVVPILGAVPVLAMLEVALEVPIPEVALVLATLESVLVLVILEATQALAILEVVLVLAILKAEEVLAILAILVAALVLAILEVMALPIPSLNLSSIHLPMYKLVAMASSHHVSTPPAL